jgi:predicted MFS family arabinose efflux permease
MNKRVKSGEFQLTERYSRYVLGVLFVVYIFNFVDRQILTVLLIPIQKEFGATDQQMGLLTGLAFALFYTFAGIPLARIADTRSRTMLITVGLTAWSALTAMSGFARSFIQLALARVGVGVGEAAATPAAHSLIADYFPPERRSRALAIYSIGSNVGMLVGLSIGGIIAEHFGWRAAFFLVGAPGLLMAVIVKMTVREPPRGLSEANQMTPKSQTTFQVLRYMFSLSSFRNLCFAASFFAISGYGMMTWTPAFFMRIHKTSIQETGMILGVIFGFGGAVGAYIGGLTCDKLSIRDPRWSMWISAIGASAMIPFSLLFLFSSNATLAVVSFTPSLIIGSLYIAPTFSMVQGLAKLNMRAMAAAILFFVLNLLGLGLGPYLVGLFSDLLKPAYGGDSLRYAMLGVLPANVLATIFYLQAARTLKTDLAKSQT